MRENKFRGYCLEKKEWFFGNLVSKPIPYIVGDMLESNDEYCSLEFWYPVVPKSVGEFTGLRDKNGREIYEGDIVLGKFLVYKNSDIETGVIVFDQGMFAFNCKRTKQYPNNEAWFPLLELVDREVIGNVYENPELLEGKR